MKTRGVFRCVVHVHVALLMLAIPALGEEITVKNDSVVDFGQAVIVGDFIQGEQAGARLTSPCDGTIVAVQILWLEGTAGHGQSLEQAIHIFADGAFPIPGSELALLEGPVMTPGYLNEFRYLDEAQTMPINVPVLAGESFFVTLEFYNPTDVGNGGPSVVRDVDGCQSNRNVLYGDLGAGWHWYDFCLLISGDLAIRAIIDCPGATGACCHASGICQNDVEAEDCLEFGDVWHEGLTCAEITCTARGACCVGSGCLTLVEQDPCEQIGDYAGDGTNCNDDVCVAGACCNLLTGECIENFGFQCVALGGDFEYQGPGTTCDPNPCTQPTGACCFGTLCFAGQTRLECTDAGGDWIGPWIDCGPPNPCEEPRCRGDCNCDGQIDFGDINPFVLALSEGVYCDGTGYNADLDENGSVGFEDINPFVALLTSGPLPIPCE